MFVRFGRFEYNHNWTDEILTNEVNDGRSLSQNDRPFAVLHRLIQIAKAPEDRRL
jgi:hypothetical protein